QTYRNHYEEVIRRGYASATICYHDIHPDVTGHTGDSVFRLFFEPEQYDSIRQRYSIIGAWAWGLSRALDCLEQQEGIDPRRVAVYGHSRLGKTALWAGATDRRFAMVISNDSGCAGGALHKRKFGENLSLHFQWHLERNVPVWFVDAAQQFIFREEDMPFDQHELLALIAPRPLAVGTASEDLEADPYGEFLACQAASNVYALYGAEGLGECSMPAPGNGCGKEISFHCRPGKHELLPEDWSWYLDFADRYL
ncbi:MAG: acetylxylan esterase, partial [Lentisphaeria bacterium]|nr:acetylxylan esterase [Lentisphaeria bacterium]